MEDIIKEIIKNAIKEDMPKGDITTDNIIDINHTSKAYFIAKEDGVLAGIKYVLAVFELIGGNYVLNFNFNDGDIVRSGNIIGVVEGSTRTILKAERLALNLMQRMSGIATITRSFVDQTNGLAIILDTRKTTPNLRIMEREAVRLGGGVNHRFCLSDMVLIKDNHIDAAGSITNAVNRVYGKVGDSKIEVEVETYSQFLEALNTNCDIIMLDNMDNLLMEKCVKENSGKKKLEASGNMTIDRISSVAKLGVDYISVGALTHSAKALDISLKFHLD